MQTAQPGPYKPVLNSTRTTSLPPPLARLPTDLMFLCTTFKYVGGGCLPNGGCSFLGASSRFTFCSFALALRPPWGGPESPHTNCILKKRTRSYGYFAACHESSFDPVSRGFANPYERLASTYPKGYSLRCP